MAKFTLFISLLLIVIIENGNCGRYVKLKDGVDEAPDSDDERYEFRPSSDVVQDLMQVTRILEIGDDHKAWVIDNAVRHEDFTDFVEIVRGGGRDFTFAHQNYTKFDGADWNYGSAPWIKEVPKNTLNKTIVWNKIKPLVEQTLGKEVKITYAQIDHLRALDAIPPKMSQFCGKNRYVLTFFLVDIFKLNSYGQLSFYTMSQSKHMSDEPRLEITESVHPHGFRATLWPACHVVLFRAPSVNFFQHLPLLHVVISTDMDNNDELISPASFAQSKEELVKVFGDFQFANKNTDRTVDYNKCLTRTFYDGIESRPIHVFDGLFTDEELRAWRAHLWKYNAGVNGFDSEPSEGHDNVQWMAALDVDNFIFSGMWPRLQQLLKFVTNETEWYPYDVALNYVRTADHTRIHPDAEKHQEEFTLLLYLSEGLTPPNFGETNWVVMKKDDGILKYIGPGGEVYETIAAVAPKFGRMVIFKNNIEHSAHPPSTSYFGGRYSFAVKVGRTKRLAFIKRVYERMEGVMMDENMKSFNQQLMVGMHDNPNKSKVTTDQLVKFFKKVAKMAKNQRTEEADRVFQHALQSF